jgi:hypothetical protein
MECITKILFTESAFWTLLSITVTWGITHLYYRKSLSQQAQESSREIGKLIDVVKERGAQNNEIIKLERVNEAVEEYRRMGTPVRVIDSYTDLTQDQKAEIYDTVMLRVKGRLGKSNKYRAK